MKTKIIIGIILLFSANYLFAQSTLPKTKIANHGFIENKGQIVDQNYQPNPDVLFLLNTPGFNVQIRKGGFSYDLYHVSGTDQLSQDFKISQSSLNSISYDSILAEYHRIDIDFRGANLSCVVSAEDQSADYLNYYAASIPVDGIINVYNYRKVVYSNIYPGIDLEFLVDETSGYKYNFVIRPGGDARDIRMMINGPDSILLQNDSLRFFTGLGCVFEVIPASYSLLNGKGTQVKVQFCRYDDGTYGYEVINKEPEGASLIIDPTAIRLWGTYYGGTFAEYGYDATVDSVGNVFIAGSTYSLNNIATTGSYQEIKIGPNIKGYLAKFDANGIRQWGTYYCGDVLGIDGVQACATDPWGNIYIDGYTSSDSGMATPGAHQTTYGGGAYDGFLAKFNTSGQRIWATWYGGPGTDQIYAFSSGHAALATDINGNVFIGGQTNSFTGIATPGSYQPNCLNNSGFLAKFDSGGIRQWGTYYAGTNMTDFIRLCTDVEGNVYAGGVTSDVVGIASPGAYQTTFGGNPTDAFLVAFSPSGQRLWATYYGGELKDEGHGIISDNNGNIYFAGMTESSTGIASVGCHQPIIGGGDDGFLAMFNNSGQLLWGTYYGGVGDDWVYCVSPDQNGNIFLGGYTVSSTNIATVNSYQPNITGGGGSDAFFAKLNIAGQRQWGTYFGGEAGEIANSIHYMTDDTIYIYGITTSSTSIATSTGHQTTFGGQQDAFLEKFLECWPLDAAGPITGPPNVCISTSGFSYSIPTLEHAVSYQWALPAGATMVNGAGTTNITVDFGSSASSGNITVYGLNKCGDAGDPTTRYVSVIPRPVPVISGPNNICSGPGKVYSTEAGKTNYQWSTSPGGVITSGGNTDTVVVTWTLTGIQYVYVTYTENGCDALIPTFYEVLVTAGPLVDVSISATTNNVCIGTPVTFTAIPTNGGTNPVYQWKVNGVDSGTNDDEFTYVPQNGDSVICILTSDAICSSNNPAISNTIVTTVLPDLPVSISIASDNPVCEGDSATFSASTANKGSLPVFQWFVNGIETGINDSTFSYTPSPLDQVFCVLTSSEQCASNNPVTSDTITMIVNSLELVGVSITVSENPVCEGLSVTFSSIPINGGSSPTHQWQVNGINTGTNNPGFTYTPVDGDLVTCTLLSNAACVINNPTTSNSIAMSVGEAPDVSFTICFDTITTLNAKPLKLKGGIPLGGIYSGPGVDQITEYFNPAMAGLGLKTITYSYTNQYTCSENTTIAISVINPVPLTCGDSLTDIRDNKKYPTIQIGSQCWLAVNLNHGQQIGGSSAQRDNCQVEKYCYNDLPANCTQYGALYQWDELMRYEDTEEIQGLCPPGWHVPSESDWNQLFTVYLGNAFAGSPLLYTGYSGFNVLLAGVEFFNQSNRFVDFASIMWSSTSHGSYKAWSHGMNEYNYSVSYYPSYRSNAFSVRCTRD